MSNKVHKGIVDAVSGKLEQHLNKELSSEQLERLQELLKDQSLQCPEPTLFKKTREPQEQQLKELAELLDRSVVADNDTAMDWNWGFKF